MLLGMVSRAIPNFSNKGCVMTRMEAVRILRELQTGQHCDVEEAHRLADRVLIELLDNAGFEAVTEEWRKVPKWYA